MNFSLFVLEGLLKNFYLEIVNEALAGKELKTAEEVLEKLDLSR